MEKACYLSVFFKLDIKGTLRAKLQISKTFGSDFKVEGWLIDFT